MSFSHYLKEIGRGPNGSRPLSQDDAQQLMSAMLDSGVPDLEFGALLIAMRMKGESLEELMGFYQALDARLYRIAAPNCGARPVVIPTYNGARRQPNLTPLIALWLKQFGVPALLHGEMEGHGRVATMHVLRELDILPCTTLAQAEARLANERIAFVPTSIFSPGLAAMLSVRNRLGVRNSAHTLVKLIDPFDGLGLRLVSVSHPEYHALLSAFFAATGFDALLMRGTEGEPVADARRLPRLDVHIGGGLRPELGCVGTEGALLQLPLLPRVNDAASTAVYIQSVVSGETPLPTPLQEQVEVLVRAHRAMQIHEGSAHERSA